MTLSVLTIVRNRTVHLENLLEGVRRSAVQPDEVIVVDMSDAPETLKDTGLPLFIDRFETAGLPLAAARNRAASCAKGDRLIFLDVDCIPMRDCLGQLLTAIDEHDALICADVRYLGPGDTSAPWHEGALLDLGRPHPVRPFPENGLKLVGDPGLFWSLAFAIRRDTFERIGGFDERFTGYGGEDTDFGFAARDAGCPLYFLGGAVACHQYHETFDPPLQHVGDIVANANRFHSKWGIWPMSGWLEQFVRLGLVEWKSDSVRLVRGPSQNELRSAKSTWPSNA
ncbi:MAG TPA: glycosyltransferase [Erythrobacter sp.]|nr:glycosyltransferase [Erythrobacter sp.]